MRGFDSPSGLKYMTLDFVLSSDNNGVMIRDPRGGHNRKKINEDFFKTWNPCMAYVLGFMYADGSLLDTDASSRTYYLQFSSNDLELLKDIKYVMGSEHAIYVRPPRAMTHRKKAYVSKTGYVLKFGNKIMYHDLLGLGMTHRKSNNMHLPKIPKAYFSYFLRGYFDGDGCINLSLAPRRITPRLKVIFTSGSTAFLSEISNALGEALAIDPPRYYQSMGAHNLMTSDATAFRVLEYIYTDLDASPCLQRKYLKYLNYKHNLMGPRVKKALGIV